MNIYYINLIQYFNLYHELTIPKGIEKLKELISDKNNKIILSVLWEVWPHETILATLEILGVTPNQDNVVLVLDVCSYQNPDHWKTVNIMLHNSVLCKVYNTENPELGPNLDNDKFLFMLGKPHKKHRIFALYELYQRNELSKCEWSLHYKSYLEDVVRCHLPNMTDNAYQEFITSTTKKIDDVSPTFQKDTIDFNPIFFNPAAEIYANTAVSLVTETTFHPELYWFITEKTWRVINNFHPFVLLDYKKTYEYLHSLGIDTFQYAVKHPYETLVGPEEDVVRMCVDNVLHLLANKDLYREELTKSVINNKKVFTDLANMYNNNVTPYIEDLICNHTFQKVKIDNAVEVYEKLWNKS
jgi:hypothetical protein